LVATCVFGAVLKLPTAATLEAQTMLTKAIKALRWPAETDQAGVTTWKAKTTTQINGSDNQCTM